jgi:hypothetical protein
MVPIPPTPRLLPCDPKRFVSPFAFLSAAGSTIFDRSANLTAVERDPDSRFNSSRSFASSSILTASRMAFSVSTKRILFYSIYGVVH